MANNSPEYKSNGHGRAGNNALAVIAIVIGIVALAVALLAYTKPGQRIGNQLQQAGQEAGQQTDAALVNMRLELERIEARTRLAVARAEHRAEQDYEKLENEIVDIRADLAEAYRRAEREASQEWRELNTELEQLEAQARAQSADVLARLESAIRALRQEIRPDEGE